MLPGQQPFQEADVATLSCDEQSHIGRLLGSLQMEGWEGVREVRKLPSNENPGYPSVQPTSVAQPWGQGGRRRRDHLLH